MILADTSIWIEHFRYGENGLDALLIKEQILIHPFICGELACGNLKDRGIVLESLNALPAVTLASHTEVLALIEEHKLSGLGIGWVDVHLLASSLQSDCHFWTLDKRLAQAAAGLGLG